MDEAMRAGTATALRGAARGRETLRSGQDRKGGALAEAAAPVRRPVSRHPARLPAAAAVVAPRERAPERRRQELLDSARIEFSSKGYGGARVDSIVARTNSNKAMLYHYFGSKENLYIAVLEQIYIDIRQREAEIDFDALAPIAAVERLIEFTFHYHVDNPSFVRMINNENQNEGAFLGRSTRIGDLNHSVIETLGRVLARGVDDGVFRDDIDATDLYISISALSFTYVANRYTLSRVFGRDLFQADALANRLATMTDMVLTYLRA